MKTYMDFGSWAVALITLILFVTALFTKGITHDLFLEVGVFLVSIKIILMSYQNGVAIRHLDKKLDTIILRLSELQAPQSAQDRSAT